MILYGENPDNYTTANLPLFWDEVSGTPGVRADGYLGRPALTGEGGAGSVTKYAIRPGINSIISEFRFGARFLFEQYPATDIGLLTAVDAGGAPLVAVVMKDDGTLTVWNASDALVTSTVLALDTTYRLGIKGNVRINGGYCEIWLNQTRIARFVGRTSSTDIPIWAGCEIGLVEDCAVNHFYMMDDYGHQGDLIPDLIWKNQRPVANGTFGDFIPTGAASNAEAVDDDDQDEDATTAGAFLVGDKMTNEVDELTTTGIVYAVIATAVARNTAVDGPSFRHLIEVGGAAYAGLGNYTQSPSEDYAVFHEMMYQRGDDGYGFTTERFNETKFGAEVLP